mgnify:FL=1
MPKRKTEVTVASGPPVIRAMPALTAKARNYPVTIMSWSMPTRVPRMDFGAVSAR